MESYEPPAQPALESSGRAGSGYGWTESPRGLCIQRYRTDSAGVAQILPPSAQNRRIIESDLWRMLPAIAELPRAALTRRCEQVDRS